MIVSFRSRETERIRRGEFSRRLPHDMQAAALRKLRILKHAAVLRDLSVPPNNRLEALYGDRAGEYSIRIDDRWRVSFRWTAGGPADVEIVDYH